MKKLFIFSILFSTFDSVAMYSETGQKAHQESPETSPKNSRAATPPPSQVQKENETKPLPDFSPESYSTAATTAQPIRLYTTSLETAEHFEPQTVAYVQVGHSNDWIQSREYAAEIAHTPSTTAVQTAITQIVQGTSQYSQLLEQFQQGQDLSSKYSLQQFSEVTQTTNLNRYLEEHNFNGTSQQTHDSMDTSMASILTATYHTLEPEKSSKITFDPTRYEVTNNANNYPPLLKKNLLLSIVKFFNTFSSSMCAGIVSHALVQKPQVSSSQIVDNLTFITTVFLNNLSNSEIFDQDNSFEIAHPKSSIFENVVQILATSENCLALLKPKIATSEIANFSLCLSMLIKYSQNHKTKNYVNFASFLLLISNFVFTSFFDFN